MNAHSITLNSFQASNEEALLKVYNMISYQINQCKLQFITDWEKDHSTSRENTDAQIAELEQKKKEIKHLLSELKDQGRNAEVSFEIKLKSIVPQNGKKLASTEAQ